MKIEQRPVYIAFDGQEFAAEHECLAYERDRSGDRLVGLTAAQIDAALNGADRDLGDAFEAFGRKITLARRERGDFKRAPKSLEQPGEPAPTPTSSDDATTQPEGFSA